MMNKLRVWHIPQVLGKAFHVYVNTVDEAVLVMNALADYDLFQYDNNIKGDYCNVSGLEMYDESLTEEDLVDMDLKDKWIEWYLEDTDNDIYYEDIQDYIRSNEE
ncbi:superinfection exclusion protein [Klebsiella phage 05F01]|nr:superinfection exclusion protein [Klebsiella phage 05F01]